MRLVLKAPMLSRMLWLLIEFSEFIIEFVAIPQIIAPYSVVNRIGFLYVFMLMLILTLHVQLDKALINISMIYYY